MKTLIPKIPVRVVRGFFGFDDVDDPQQIDGADLFADLMNVKTPEDFRVFQGKYETSLHTELRERAYGKRSRRNDQFSDLIQFQSATARALQIPLHKWKEEKQWRGQDFGRFDYLFRNYLPHIELSFTEDGLEGICADEHTTLTIVFFVFLQKAAGAEYRNCARNKCSRLFLVESQTSKKYCSPACAHSSAVQAQRDRERKLRRRPGKGRN